MDQLRKAWAWFVRYHFWVLIVVATAVAIFCWYSGASTLAQQFKDNKAKIDQQFSAISQLQSTPFKPNQSVNDKQQEQIDVQQQAVRAMWQQLYDRQRADVLKWPSNLSDQFRNHVEGLKFGDTIPVDLRNHYNNYVRDHFPELPKIVGAILAPEGEGGIGRGSYSPGGMMSRGGEYGSRGMPGDPSAMAEEEEDFIVEWLDQDVVRQELYRPTTPSSKRIWKTQEDLWVYEALLKIIAATNKAKGADRFSTAAVRVIESLEVGQPAAQQSRTKNRIDFVEPSAGVAGGMGGEGGFSEFGGAGEGGVNGGSGSPMGAEGGYSEFSEFGPRGPMGMSDAGDTDLFANRYIDPNGMPMSTAPETSTEFKRLPVRMRLWMDERWLPHLISECANAPLQVDVQEVRINPSEQGGMGGYGRGGGSMAMPTQGEVMVPEAEPNMKTVILQGIIYIFNPPTDQSAEAGQVAGF